MGRAVENPRVVAASTLVLSGAFLHDWSTFADGDATPSVSGGYGFKTANTAPTTITNFDDPDVNGQSIVLIIGDANTTIQDLSNGSNIRLQGGIDYGPSAAYDSFEFEYDGADWVERSRNPK